MLAVHNTAMGLAIAVCFGGAFSLVANGTMAFALSMVPATKAGLGTGISFSGGALAMSLWGLLLGGGTLSPGWSALFAAMAFLLAA